MHTCILLKPRLRCLRVLLCKNSAAMAVTYQAMRKSGLNNLARVCTSIFEHLDLFVCHDARSFVELCGLVRGGGVTLYGCRINTSSDFS